MAGIDCVVHLAGMPVEAAWEKVLPLNIEGCYNVFEAARRAGVKRIIFASSNHAVGFHRRERFIDTNVVPRPDTRYGVSKVFGEALGRLYADKYGLSVACLRIGSFLTPDRPTEARQLLTWISHRDMVQLVRRCIDYPDLSFRDRSTAFPTICAAAGIIPTSSFSDTGPRTIPRYLRRRSWRSAKKRMKSRRSSTGASTPRWNLRATPRRSIKLAKGIALTEEQHGLARGLTKYGDADFSLYLRRSFAKSMGYSAEMLSRPVVGIAQSASGFNNCHRHFPELVEAVKRGVLDAGGLPLDFPTISLGGSFLKPHQHDVPQPDGDGRGRNDPRAADGCGGADRRLRQVRAGAADGCRLGRPACYPASWRSDAADGLSRRTPRGVHRLSAFLGKVPGK